MRLIPPNRYTKYWHIEIMIDGEKTEKSTFSTSEKVALERLEQYEKAAAGKEALSLLQGESQLKQPVSNILSMYEETDPTCYPDELRRRRNRIKIFQKWLISHDVKDINQISPRTAKRFAKQVLIYKVGTNEESLNKTYNDKVKFFRHLFKEILTDTELKTNPFSYVKLRSTVDSRTGRPFTDDEIVRILERCKKIGKEWYELTLLAIYTGMRYVDCCFIKWENIEDIEVNGISMKVATIIPRKTRKTKQEQTFAIPPELDPMLQKQKKKKSAYILPIRHKAYRANANSMYNQIILNPLKIVSDEKNKIWFHCTRHTCATKLGEMGVDEKTAMKMTGLTDTKTLKVYNQDVKHLAEIAQNIHFKTACAVPKTKTEINNEQ